MDRADNRYTRRYERRLERALAHPWQESARFCLAYSAGVIPVELAYGQPVAATIVRCGIAVAIVGVLLGLSMRGGWHHRLNQRRLDRIHQLMVAPPTAWYPDPSGRHEFRFWNGQRWTDFALDHGVQCADPLPEP